MTKNPPPAEAEVPEPAPGTTIGQMTPEQRRMITRRAAAQLQEHLTRMAPAIAEVLDLDEAGQATDEETDDLATPTPDPTRYIAAVGTEPDVVTGAYCDVEVLISRITTYRLDDDDTATPEYEMTNIKVMDTVATDVRTDDPDKLTKAPRAADDILEAAGWQRTEDWVVTDNALLADVERIDGQERGQLYDGGDIGGAAKTVEATLLGGYYGWRLPVGNAMETLVRVEATPAWVRMYIQDTGGPGRHERSAGQLRLTDDVTLYDPARVPEGEIFTVQVEAGSDDGSQRQAVHPAESVVQPWGTDPFDMARWVRSNQTVADGPNVRIRVWHGLDADTGSEPAAEVDLDAERRRDNHRVRMWAGKFAAETIRREPPRWLEPTDTNLAAVFTSTVRPVSPGLYPRIREEFLRQAHEPVPFNPGSGVVPGYMAGWCGHRVAATEWAAGFRVCERCPDPRATAPQQTYTYQLRVTPLADNPEPLSEVVEQETIHVPAGRSPSVVAAELAASTNPKLIGAPDEHWAIVMWPGTEPTGQAAAMYTGADLATDLAADLAEYWRAATEALRHTYDGIDDLEHQLGKLRGVGVKTKRLRKAAARAIKALKQVQEAAEAATGDQV